MDFKVPEDLHIVRNGRIMDTREDEESIGMPQQMDNPFEPFSEGEEQRTGPSSGRIFKRGSDKSDGAGTINKNGEYGPISYGY